MKAKTLFIRERFSPLGYPNLYSKRGFEKKRIKINIPDNRKTLVTIKDKNNKILNIEL